MIDIDKYARDYHALIVVKDKVPPEHQTHLELVCGRVVELLDLVEDRDVEIAGLKKIRKRNEKRMGEMAEILGALEQELEAIRPASIPKVGGLDD